MTTDEIIRDLELISAFSAESGGASGWERPNVSLLSIAKVGNILGISRSGIYRLIEAGALERVHIGRRALVTNVSVLRYRTSLVRGRTKEVQKQINELKGNDHGA